MHAVGADCPPQHPLLILCAFASNPAGGKQFAKDTVYKAHLTGKAHRKAAEKLKESGNAATIDISTEKKKYEEKERAKQKEVAKLVCGTCWRLWMRARVGKAALVPRHALFPFHKNSRPR